MITKDVFTKENLVTIGLLSIYGWTSLIEVLVCYIKQKKIKTKESYKKKIIR